MAHSPCFSVHNDTTGGMIDILGLHNIGSQSQRTSVAMDPILHPLLSLSFPLNTHIQQQDTTAAFMCIISFNGCCCSYSVILVYIGCNVLKCIIAATEGKGRKMGER